MADLPSILGGMAQGFTDFGKGLVDMFGTGGAAIGDLVEGIRTGKVTTKNQDDFRKWLYQTDDVQDAAAKGLGTALNGVQTVIDYIPGIGAVTKNPLFNAGQGALGGLADEFKTYGKDYDLARAGERAAISAGGALASSSLGDALKGTGNPLLSSGTVQGLARGATGGAITAGGYAGIDGGDVLQSALQGAGTGALIGGATGAIQDFKPAKTYDVALTDEEKAARIANAKNMLSNEQNPERIAELNDQIKRLGGTLESTLVTDDQAVNNPKLTPEQEAFYKNSVMRDANGNLMPMYHSTPNEFTAFDDSRLGQNTAYDNTAFGHFVTNDKDFSSRFKDIDNTGTQGRTMELYANVENPITHPYGAAGKYSGADLDNIVKKYYEALDDPDAIAAIKDWADESGQSLYSAYMDMMLGESPFENAAAERELLKNKGYDAVEFVEGLKKQLVDGSTDTTPVSSYAVFSGNKLKDINNLNPTNNQDIMRSYGDYGYSRYDSYGDAFDPNAKSIGSQDVAPIDPATLPEGYDFYKKVTQQNKNKYGYAYDAVMQDTGKSASKITKADLETYLKDNYPDYYEEGKKYTKWDLEKDITAAIEDELVDEGYENGADLSSLVHNRYPNAGIRDIYVDHSGKTGRLDRELSKRLGIGESTSPLMDKLNQDNGTAAGDVSGKILGVKHDSWTGGTGEDKLSTMGHERLHLFQNNSNGFDYEQVQPVYKELSEDLSKAMLNDDELLKAHGKDLGRGYDLSYWKRPAEQEARMLEAYLYDRGYTKGRPYRAEEFASKMDIIRPAFDKFFDKLRDLSKRGVALPAIAALFGGGAYMASQDKDKKEVK